MITRQMEHSLHLTFNVLEGASFGKTEVTISRVEDGYMKDGVISNSEQKRVYTTG